MNDYPEINEVFEIELLDWEIEGVTEETTFEELLNLFEEQNAVYLWSDALSYFRDNATDVYKISMD